MKLSYRQRRLLSVVVLCVVLPIYILVVVTLIDRFERLPAFLELALYVVLGVAWVFPLKFIFKGVGKENQENGKEDL